MPQNPKAVVSAILFKKEGGEIRIYLQTRWKPDASPTYSGILEIPAGGIDAYENIYDALHREVKEECGLDIVKVVNDYRGSIREPRVHDKVFVFQPFVCQEVLETKGGLPWIGFVFLCEVAGEAVVDPNEAKDPRWVSISELSEIVKTNANQIFPLQFPALEYFLERFPDLSL